MIYIYSSHEKIKTIPPEFKVRFKGKEKMKYHNSIPKQLGY